MSAQPRALRPAPGLDPQAFRLRPLALADVPHILSWVAGPLEAYWLAPRTAPPLTAAKIAGWAARRDQWPRVLVDALGEPLAYGELNLLERGRGDFWLGHLLVRPELRRRGVGRVLTRGLLAEAAAQHARRVLLVVFEGNRPAIRCYQACGFVVDGHELHHFPAYSRTETLVRLAYECPA